MTPNPNPHPEQDRPARVRHTLPKEERLCGRTAINALIDKGKYGEVPGVLRYRFLTGTGSGLNRIMVSVPKRNFKRAVRRNLLKRRIRESWRLQKHLLSGTGTDILIFYISREILSYRDIHEAVGRMIARLNARPASKAAPRPAETAPHTENGTPAGNDDCNGQS